MPHSTKSPSMPRRVALALVVLIALLVVPATAGAAAPRADGGVEWTTTLAPDLSAHDLGLRPGASARELARAALERKAGRLGLRGPASGLRLVERPAPRTPHANRLQLLSFQQTAGGLRVVWSEIEVAISGRRVSSISATVVPANRRLAGERQVDATRAAEIAAEAIEGPEEALTPLPVAYAGTPSTRRGVETRVPRRAWVVEATPASALGAEVATPICIVVDAESGEVIGRWSGIADRPDRGVAPPTAVAATAARATVRTPVVKIYDGSAGGSSFPRYGQFFASDSNSVSPFDGHDWDPATAFEIDPGKGAIEALVAPAHNVMNAARTVCTVRHYCGKRGFPQLDPNGRFRFWDVVVNYPGNSSGTILSSLLVTISAGDRMPRNSFNDVVAHELGHAMDIVYAGDRIIDFNDKTVGAVQEALGDMFALDYDRQDTTMFEESATGVGRHPGNPASESLCDNTGCHPYPAHMNNFDSTPPNNDEHYNSTILSHGFVRFVERAGFTTAGEVLQYIPFCLSPRPTFQQVSSCFYQRSMQLYGSTVARSARLAFESVGLPPVALQ